MKHTRLGDLLVDAKAITQEQLTEALRAQKGTGRRLGDVLVSEGFITERQLIDALMLQLGIDYVDPTTVDIDPELCKLVPKSLAKKYSVVPVRTKGDDLYLAMADSLNFIASEEVKAASRKRIVPMIATEATVSRAISALYGTEGARRAIREMQAEGTPSTSDVTEIGTEVGDEAGVDAPSIRLVNSIIERGMTDHASDIHIEPQEGDVLVRMRFDGMLHNVFTVPKELQPSLTSRIKIMCGMDVTERRVPQDGRAIVRLNMHEADLRASTLPTVHGEKLVLRILDRDSQQDTPEELGFYGHNLEAYNNLLKNTQGMILIVGPTGSGKTSTMYTMIERLNSESVNIVTLEDPVEYNIRGVNQVQVNEKAGTTFASGLRSILRQDPDIVVVGEIRDAETAAIAMRAAVTGHLVLSTIHTGDALSTLDRLDDIGVEPFMVADALKGVISQRLVRTICPHCRETYEPSDEELLNVGITPGSAEAKGVEFSRGAGCSDCLETGYRGRTAVAEVLAINDELRSCIRRGATHEELNAAATAAGFEPILANCRELVEKGVTTVDEVMRCVYATV